MQSKPLFVRAEWDEEAAVWVATSDDVPGLAGLDQKRQRLRNVPMNAVFPTRSGGFANYLLCACLESGK